MIKRIFSVKKIKYILAAVLYGVSVLLLAGCGSGDSSDSIAQEPASSPTVVYKPGNDIEIVYPEYISESSSQESGNFEATASAIENEEDRETAVVTTVPGGFAVSSSASQATWVGMNVLAEGGNAVDAAVAMSFVLGVVEPSSSGLGGSGMMLIYDPASDSSYFLDYYGSSGSAAVMTDEVAIPGFLKGMETALKTWGTISLADALEPAIQYAENGFTASDYLMARLSYSGTLFQNPAFADVTVGDTVVQEELANSLKLIQRYGTDVFYSGQIASDIAAKCGLSASDFASYEVYCSEALESSFMGCRVLSGNAPSSGMTVAQMLGIAEALNIPSAQDNLSGYLTVLQKATLLAYSQRQSLLVDPRAYDFDGDLYVSEDYIASLLEHESVSAAEDDPEQMCTTQFSVIDGSGMVVCVTNTLSENWGSYILVDGFYLNNSLSNFGTVGVNAYAPNQRPRTHFAPTIILGDDGYMLALGSPGGKNIPRIVVPVIIDILQNGTDVQTAIDRIRAIYDENGALCIETNDDDRDTFVKTSQIPSEYYYSTSHLYFGCVSAVGYDPESGVFAASDRRRSTSQAMYYPYVQQ